MLKKLWIIIFIACFSFAYTNNLPGEKVEEIKKSFDLKKIKNINIVNINGKIILEKGEKDNIDFYAKKIAPNMEVLQNCSILITEEGDSLNIKVKYKEKTKSFFKKNPIVNIYLKVGGELNSMEATSVNGNIFSQIKSKQISLKTVNGSIESEDEFKEISLSSVNGNIDSLGNGKEIEAKSVNGGINVTCKRKFQGNIGASSVNGRLSFYIHEKLTFNFNGKNMNGPIKSDFNFVKIEKQSIMGNKKAESKIENSNISIKASTLNGEIRLIKD